MADGKMSTNIHATLLPDEPSVISAVIDRVFSFEAATAGDDLDCRQDWQNVWKLNYNR